MAGVGEKVAVLDETMRAWRAGPEGLDLVTAARPRPRRGELLVRVLACGVCRTDLHVVDRELPVHRRGVIPGHQVVGVVHGLGAGTVSSRVGDLVGVAWLHHTCGACRWCRSGRENLCPNAAFTGWDADGGYAEFVTVPEAFAYALPDGEDIVSLAPLLCAGIIGYRALDRARLPSGGHLGIYGFGSSGHITAQIAQASGARVSAMTRGEKNRQLARELGLDFVGEESDAPPQPLDSAIVFAPAGELVLPALRATTRGGTVVLAGIHMSDLPSMAYEPHLFYERDLRTVTANTRADGDAFLRLAAGLRVRPTVTRYGFEQVRQALDDLRSGSASGSLVIEISPRTR